MAFEHFRAHLAVHLKFLSRSRVLLGFVILIVAGSSIAMLPALFFETSTNQFAVLKMAANHLHWSASMITSGLGLFALWSHRRTRTIKMVATKPSHFGGWVASIFVAAAAVGLAAHAAVATLTAVLSLYWGVPYQSGFLFIAADSFIESLVLLAFLTALGAALHPVLAVLAVFLFNEGTFGFLATILAGAANAGAAVPLAAVWQKIVTALYYVAPAFGPFDHKTEALHQSLRATTSDWRYLAASLAYAMLACAFGYVATIVFLRRQQLT
jgi:hypothetical protein